MIGAFYAWMLGTRDLDTETETRRLWDSILRLRLRQGISKTGDWDWKIWFFETETETETQKIGLTRLRLSWDLIDTESLVDLWCLPGYEIFTFSCLSIFFGPRGISGYPRHGPLSTCWFTRRLSLYKFFLSFTWLDSMLNLRDLMSENQKIDLSTIIFSVTCF